MLARKSPSSSVVPYQSIRSPNCSIARHFSRYRLRSRINPTIFSRMSFSYVRHCLFMLISFFSFCASLVSIASSFRIRQTIRVCHYLRIKGVARSIITMHKFVDLSCDVLYQLPDLVLLCQTTTWFVFHLLLLLLKVYSRCERQIVIQSLLLDHASNFLNL